MAGRDAARRHESLLEELNEERAAALFRISRTLESLIADLHAAGDRLRRASRDDYPGELDAYRALRARALKYRWYLEVQREALGLRQHHLLDEFYRIPPADPL